MLHRFTLVSKRFGALLLAFCLVSGFLATSSQAIFRERLAAPTETIINSNITTDTTWTLANSPYHLTNHIEVNAGVTLTIEPGVEVWIGEKFYVHVREGASIIAKGTPTQHITIDRYIDPITQLGPRWRKIWFHENTTSYFRYVDFAYGGAAANSDDTTLHFEGAGTHVLNNCLVRASKQQGIVASGGSLNVTVAGTLFQDNGRYPIIADSGANVAITGSTLQAGDSHAIFLRTRTVPATITIADSNLFSDVPFTTIQNDMYSSACINAQNNWWGAANGPYDGSSVSDACGLGSNGGGGSWVSNGADYRNWLTAEAPRAGITTPPNATFTITPDPTVVQPPGTEYTFDASDSTDVEDYTSSLEVCWDWDDNGTCDTAYLTTKTTTHVFAAGAAMQTVRLVARDTDGLTSEATQDVVLNSPPTAAFTVNPDPATPLLEDTVYTFDASTSSDVEDDPADLNVCWDWDNSGDCTDYSTTKTATHSFAYADGAVQTVRLVVRDIGSLTGEMTKTIHILQNLPPTATFIFTQTAWSQVYFDASASADDCDAQAVLQVAWDYEGNGQDTGYSITKTTSYTYPHLARYWPTVYVKDTTDRVGTSRQPLNIVPPTATTTITGSGDVLTSTDGTVQIAVYTDTVGGEVISNGLVITHTPWLTLPHDSLTGTFTYQGFNLSAQSLLTGSQPIDEISGTYTITISYDYDYFANVLHLPFEDQLELYHWSGADAFWMPVTSTLNTAANQLVATTGFFGDFALVMDVCRIYMPLIAREN